MLYNGFGEHNIQGIGDKHIPLIHNVTNTDVAVAVSDHATDQLFVLFNDPAGRALLRSRGVSEDVLAALPHFGLSSICNIVAAIKTAKALGLGAQRGASSPSPPTAPRSTPRRIAKANAKHFGGRLRRRARGRDVCHPHHAGATPSTCCRLSRGRAPPHLQPRLLHLGRAARRRAGRFRGAARPGASGAACTPGCRHGTSMIAAFNQATGMSDGRCAR